jgi:histidinol-phosphatase (PHP family)
MTQVMKLKLSCIHTHTFFCDGKGTVEDFCRAALEKGFDSLGFSAHAPIEKKTGIKTDWNLSEEKLEEYLDTVRAAKKSWKGKLDVFLGLEVDFIPGLMGPSDRDFSEMELDYIIGSVHFIRRPKGEPFAVDGPPEELERGLKESFGGDAEALVNSYWDSVEALIRAGGFEVLGHADLIKKNNGENRFFSEAAEFYCRRCESAAALAAKYNVTAEINTGGMNRKKTAAPYPSRYLLKAFLKNRVPMVINADAHRIEDLDGHYDDAVKTLLAAGYTETKVFGGKNGGRPVWRTIGLT